MGECQKLKGEIIEILQCIRFTFFDFLSLQRQTRSYKSCYMKELYIYTRE